MPSVWDLFILTGLFLLFMYSDSLSPDDESSPSSTVKNKHLEEDPTEEHEVKRLKFDTEDEEEEQAAKSETSSSQTSSEMAEEAESVSESDEKEEEEEEEEKESSDSEHAAEGGHMSQACSSTSAGLHIGLYIDHCLML